MVSLKISINITIYPSFFVIHCVRVFTQLKSQILIKSLHDALASSPTVVVYLMFSCLLGDTTQFH